MPRLSDKSLLAIAAVVDVAIHARGAPVAAKALAARHSLPPAGWSRFCRRWFMPAC